MNPLPLVLADLRRHASGAIAIGFLVAITVAVAVTVAIVERALRTGSAAAARDADLVIGAAGSPTQLMLSAVFLDTSALPLTRPETLGKILSDPRVAWASPVGFGDRWRTYPIIGVAPALLTLGGRRPLAEGQLFREVEEAVVGASVPVPLGTVLVPQHGVHHSPVENDGGEDHGHDAHAGEQFRVVGRLPPSGTAWDRAILVPIEAVWQIHGFGTGHAEGETQIGPPWAEARAGVPAIIVKPRGVADAYALRAQWRSGETTAVFPAEILIDLYGILGNIRMLLSAMSLAMQGLVIAAVMLAVMATLAGRRRLIAVLRAIGSPRRFIFAAVWLELAVVLTLASLAGWGFGIGGATLLCAAAAGAAGFALPVVLSVWDGVLVALVVVMGLVAAALAALWALRGDIAAGLRS